MKLWCTTSNEGLEQKRLWINSSYIKDCIPRWLLFYTKKHLPFCYRKKRRWKKTERDQSVRSCIFQDFCTKKKNLWEKDRKARVGNASRRTHTKTLTRDECMMMIAVRKAKRDKECQETFNMNCGSRRVKVKGVEN
jgi:hypothetical protein